ncbi:hypothetical protein FRC17_001109 [Serendipita sp. 399]|nr:hypothetical protein FRC17_001109 [Serendipita sp. 399]
MLAPVGEPTSSTAAPALFRIPLDVDIPLHGLPGPLLLLDFFLFEAKFSRKVMTQGAPLLAASIGLTYSTWVEHCATKNGFFPYPFLTLSPFPVRVLIYTTCTAVSLFMLRAANGLHR